MKAKRILRDPETGEIVGATRVPFSSKLNLKEPQETFVEKNSRTIITLVTCLVIFFLLIWFGMPASESLLLIIVLGSIMFFANRWAKREEKRELQAKLEREREEREKARIEKRDRQRYDQWLQRMPTKLSQKGFASLDGKDRNELFFIYQLLMNGGDLNQLQKRLMEIALADTATVKFLELKGSQGNVPSPENSLSPQMSGAFSALGIAAGAGIIQRGQIRQELNEINESMDDGSGGEVDSGGFDF